MFIQKFSTLAELYSHSVANFSENECFSIYGKEKLTYSDFSSLVEKVADILFNNGISSGDKVILLGQNMSNWNAGYFAAVKSGFTTVPVLPDFSADEINGIISHSDAKAAIVSKKQYSKLSEISKENLEVIIMMDDLTLIKGKNIADTTYTVINKVESNDIAAIIYTSGTTSKPKGVMLTHNNLCSQLSMAEDLQKVVPSDIFLSLLPLSHTYECSLGILLPFMHGASVVYIEKPPTANILLPILKNVRPTTILSVPLIIEKIYKTKIASKINENSLNRKLYGTTIGRKLIHKLLGKKVKATFGGRVRFFGVGGSKIDPVVERFLYEAGFPYAIGYGLTETAPLIAGVSTSTVRIQSTGPQLKGVELKILNPNPLTGEGEIIAKGPNVMAGYYKNEEATKEAFTEDGWFRTQDLGVFDKNGYLYIKGRLNNMIVGASGENIYPEEIEHVINGHSMVVDSLVKEEKGKLVALVQFNREELEKKYDSMKDSWDQKVEQIKAELLHYVNSKVNRFSRISLVVEQAGTFEKTPTHKIKRFLYN
ncbi:MAG: AMP-binding protein [Rikenellaceae bacterium]|nr:AMP-binding protein [Rikenellaceae bacterium]